MMTYHIRTHFFLLLLFLLLISSTCVQKQTDTEYIGFPKEFIPDGIGVNIHFMGAPPKDMELIKQANIKLIRADLTWTSIERSPGSYDFSQYDVFVDACEEQGIRILFILDYKNKLYGSEKSIKTERQRIGFALFAQEAVKHYKGKGIIWEIWNEPNMQRFWGEEPNVEDYMALVAITCDSIRSIEPHALIIAPATVGIDKKFIEPCLEKGLLEYVDAISVHPYRKGGPESVYNGYNSLRKLMKDFKPRNSPEPQIISSEWGWKFFDLTTEIDGEVAPQLRQAAYLVRRFCLEAYAGIACGIYYKWREDNYGLIRSNYSTKPSYTAFKVLIDQLTGYCETVTRLDIGTAKTTFVLVFKGPSGKKYVAWRTKETETVYIPFNGAEVKAIDFLGNPMSVKSNNNTLEIKLSEKPIFIEF